MVAPSPSPVSTLRWARLLGIPAAALVAALAGASWYFTAPLEDRPSSSSAAPPVADVPKPPPPVSGPPPWPEGTLDGMPAKTLLLSSLEYVARELESEDGYTALFRKQERVDGKLLPEQTMRMKLRHRPFSIYLKWLSPNPGKEVVFAAGHREDKMIAHMGDWTDRLLPRVALDPTSSLAMADNRHPITEAGLSHLTAKLIHFRRLDLASAEAQTVLDRATTPDGRPMLRSRHTHSSPAAERPFARIEVFYDPETRVPMMISSYDWPAPGHTGDLVLGERYIYSELDLHASPVDLDFDPANPEYGFKRY